MTYEVHQLNLAQTLTVDNSDPARPTGGLIGELIKSSWPLFNINWIFPYAQAYTHTIVKNLTSLINYYSRTY